MRISDWSSDVCSSDLGPAYADGRRAARRAIGRDRLIILVEQIFDAAIKVDGVGERPGSAQVDKPIAGEPHAVGAIIEAGAGAAHQIGRAPVREGVCLYV